MLCNTTTGDKCKLFNSVASTYVVAMIVSVRLPKDDEVKRFHELEQEGLHRAEARDSKSKGDVAWFQKVQTAVNEEMRPFFSKMGENDWENFGGNLSTSAYYGAKAAQSCEYSGELKENCPTGSNVWDYLVETDRLYKTLPNRPPPASSRCSHFANSAIIETPSQYRLHHALNDVTACLHRSIEHYEEMARTWHKEGKCMWRE